ncbi:MAG: hypothetical protein ACR2MO_03845 [Acidimicrobiales bacterium]
MTAADVPGGDAGRDLYGLAPGEFTAARNALAKQLKASGDKAGAALVAKLRRPLATAWALNKVARQRPAAIEAVVDAGADLRAATERALAGDASSLRTAQAVERQAVDGATTAAAAFLTEAGLGAGDGPRQRMAGTLRAAMVDGTVAAALREGVLDDDRDAPGFGLDAFSASAAGSATRRRAPARGRAAPKPDDDGSPPGTSEPADAGDAADDPPAAEAAAAEREAAARVEAAEEAERRAADLGATADDAERGAEAARDAAAAARAEAEDANARARDAARAAAAATAAALTARSTADDAAARADQARRAAAEA